jgi:hypothetical protein
MEEPVRRSKPDAGEVRNLTAVTILSGDNQIAKAVVMSEESRHGATAQVSGHFQPQGT